MNNPSQIKIGPVTQKVLLLLLGGLALGLTHSPRRYFQILKGIRKNWEAINRRALRKSIRRLYQARLIETRDNPDGSCTIHLTQKGKERALTYKIDEVEIPFMQKWDKKWRVILFDIPEKHKKARDALSRSLKRMGFYRFQKSVFVHPFECQNEIDFVVEFFSLRPYVRIIIGEHIDNELDLKRHFHPK